MKRFHKPCLRAVAFASVLLSLVLSAMSGFAASLDELNSLAHSGRIQEDAPVKADAQMHIAASRAVVWAILVDAPSWPRWNHQIQKVEISGPLAPKVRFDWNTGSTTIHSQIQLFEPERRLAWTGTALTAKAVHVWYLSAAEDGQTEVSVKESMEGFLIKQLFPSEKLKEADTDWLLSLKHAAESPSR